MIHANYTLSLADFKAALRLHGRQRMWRRVSYTFFYVIVPILAIVGTALFVFGHFLGKIDLDSPYRIILGVLLWLSIFLPMMQFINIRRSFKAIFPSASKDRAAAINIDDERVISSVVGLSEGAFYWPAIVEFAQDEKITLLYIAKNRFLLIPTSAFSPSQRSELDELVAQHLIKR